MKISILTNNGIRHINKNDGIKTIENEDNLQDICYRNPRILPFNEIEPMYDGSIPLCRELPLKSGFCDIVYINSSGMITVVETKLWRNPQARREVVSQILDYAKSLTKLSFEEFEDKCIQARKGSEKSLYEIIPKNGDDIDEAQFCDRVSINLRRGRFLLLIVGDGIHDNAKELTDFINQYANMCFTLAMVEIPVYEIDENMKIVIPRVIMQTTQIEREVYINTDKILEFVEAYKMDKRATTATESEFYNQLGSNISAGEVVSVKNMVDEFIDELDLKVVLGRGKNITLSFKDNSESYNFGTIWPDGHVQFYGIVESTEKIGRSDIGENYLERLAGIMNGIVEKKFARWQWTVMRDGKYLQAIEYFEKKDEWKELISETLVEIAAVEY